MLFGSNPAADVLLATLGLTRNDVGRFRDCYVADGKIAIYTRNGGGNRKCWDEDGSEECDCTGCFMTYRVHKLPYYSHDEDDDFDSTYATIYFDFPDAYADALRALDSGEKWNPDQRWHDLITSLKSRSGGEL